MFKIEKNNAVVGKYIADLIDLKPQYKSRRAFCVDYLRESGNNNPSNEEINNMSNRLSQIIKGAKAIQTYDLPVFTKLLGVSCEQILSAGEYSAPISNRETNYSIACSKDKARWKKYVEREDKLILNCDEYCKTVIDYAIEFGNYDFLKFLMDNGYIVFDSGNEKDYIRTFGAKTTIKHRDFRNLDWGFEAELKEKDELRMNLISLAADKGDMKMLNELRAREVPEMYWRANYLSGEHPDFDASYNDRMVKHIASSKKEVVDYFTDSFDIHTSDMFRNGSKQPIEFIFPYISKLLDYLISGKHKFTETALKKAIEYNESVYQRLCEIARSIKNDESYSSVFPKELWLISYKDGFSFFENGNIVTLRVILPTRYDGLVTNIAHVTKVPDSQDLKLLAEELNKSYEKIITITDHLEEI